ncbi:MAG: DUF2063 domain-containing protein [Methylophilaceae bacterium]
MLEFQKYQLAFTSHIRDPKTHAKPAKVKDKRMAVYREIVFNNILGSVSACFPVCQQVLGKRDWLKLTKQFFAAHQASTPLFREIPQEFLKFLTFFDDIPDYLQQLAHYEWVELSVNMQAVETPKISISADLLNETPILAPAHRLLEYDFPVHKISKKFKPTNPEKTFLLVFRNLDLKVKFIELNPMTYILLNILLQNELTGKQALANLAEDMQHPNKDVIITFGLDVLQDLVNQQAIIGSLKK